MKKLLCALLSVCMLLSVASSLAEGVEAQLVQIIRNTLEGEELTYDYDEEHRYFTLTFELGGVLDTVDIAVFPYDDRVSVMVTSPLPVTGDSFERAAIFTTLVNNRISICQFQVDPDYGLLMCSAGNVVERVLPAEEEIATLLYMPLVAMDNYASGIAAVCQDGADPYEAFSACLADISAQGE